MAEYAVLPGALSVDVTDIDSAIKGDKMIFTLRAHLSVRPGKTLVISGVGERPEEDEKGK